MLLNLHYTCYIYYITHVTFTALHMLHVAMIAKQVDVYYKKCCNLIIFTIQWLRFISWLR